MGFEASRVRVGYITLVEKLKYRIYSIKEGYFTPVEKLNYRIYNIREASLYTGWEIELQYL